MVVDGPFKFDYFHYKIDAIPTVHIKSGTTLRHLASLRELAYLESSHDSSRGPLCGSLLSLSPNLLVQALDLLS